MKPDDKVKAFVKIGLMKKPEWRECVYKGISCEQHEVEIHGRIYKTDEVKLWQPLHYDENGVCPALDQFTEENWGQIKKTVRDSVQHFFPNKSVEVDENNRSITVEGITISSSVMEVKTIGSIIEFPCWDVWTYKSIPATHWEPEDVDEIVLAQERGNIQAAKALIDALWRQNSDPYFENLAEDEWQKSFGTYYHPEDF